MGPWRFRPGANVTELTVSQTGEVTANGASVGQFRIVDFPDDEGQLISVGLGCFQAPEDVDPVPVEETLVRQGCQESSNVQMIDELVSMIMVTRTYEANVKLVNVKKDTTNSVIGVAMG